MKSRQIDILSATTKSSERSKDGERKLNGTQRKLSGASSETHRNIFRTLRISRKKKGI